MKEPLHILMLEDNDMDAEIIQRLLRKTRPDARFKVVMTKEDYLFALENFKPGLILSDSSLPQFSVTEALRLLKEHSLEIPFIMVTGSASPAFAASILLAGAANCISKDSLAGLPAAIDAVLLGKGL